MSRIGRLPVEIPDDVTIKADDAVVTVSGPKGSLSYELQPEIGVIIEDKTLNVFVKKPSKKSPAFWGLTRSLIANMVSGVTQGYVKELELVGVGYRVKMEGQKLSMTVGFSHSVFFDAPEGITFEVPDNKKIIIKGFDKQLVGLTAARIRKIKKPEPYKGKGIRYVDEVVKKKAGKAGKV